MENKIKTGYEIGKFVSNLREQYPTIKIVTTNGAFDLIHSGHLYSLKKAKSYGDVLIVGLNSDSSIKKYKSSLRPIIPEIYRAELLSALELVNYVVIFNETDPRELLKVIKPDFHVKSKTGYKGLEAEVLNSYGGKIILIDDIPGFSSTDIINKIKTLIEVERGIKSL